MKLFLSLMICFLIISGCNIFNNEPTGTEFPVDFRGSWLNETIDEIEGDLGFIITEKEMIYWNHNGPDDEPANCYFTHSVAELISYKGNKYTLLFQPIFF